MSWNSRQESALRRLAREAGTRWRLPWRGWGVFGLGVLAGTLLQLQQARLAATALYGLALLLGGAGLLGLAWVRGRTVLASWAWQVLVGVMAGMVAWGGAGLRGAQLQQQALVPELEGRDLVLVGQVASLPQSGDWGWRFVLRVESARQLGRPVAVPPELLLGWNPRQHPASGLGDHGPDHDSDGEREGEREGESDLVEGAMGTGAGGAAVGPGADAPVPGQRWRFTVRLKRVHGARNPGGVDYELWLWEQGILATGWVRARSLSEAPRLLARTAAYPVERLRYRVREAILATLGAAAEPGAGAGVVVALVTGDQRSIRWSLTIKPYAGFPLKPKATW